MTLAPRFLVTLWARYRAAQFARKLKTPGHSVAAQKTAFAARMQQFHGTRFGQHHRLTATLNYEQFRATMPLLTHHYYQPLVERLAAGESDLLSAGRCRLFVQTAGTTDSKPKLLPVTGGMLAHFRQALTEAIFLHFAKTKNSDLFLGRHLHFGASTAAAPITGGLRTTLDGVLALCMSPWVEANLYSPPRAVGDLPEGPEKAQATAQAMLGRDVTLIGGSPAAIAALADTVRDSLSNAKRRVTHLQAVWPNLQCYAFAGAPLGLHQETLRSALGPTVQFHEIYAAAEGIFAAQDASSPTALRLLADTGIFFEFLPMRRYVEETLSRAGPECVPLEKVQTGVDYALIVTTPAGLCRYVTGDIVRFVSTEPPRLQFAGRTRMQLNQLGEHVSERELVEVLTAVCQRNGWQAVNFHVAPLSVRPVAGKIANSHEWWVELRTHSIKTPTANVLGPEFDTELIRRNVDYAAKRASGALDEPTVRLVMPGLFEQWNKRQRQAGAVACLPHCRADRKIAEQLAGIARFHYAAETTAIT